MNPATDFGTAVAAWAAREPTVSGLVLIGSRERAAEDLIWRADPQSDWDYQIITSRPQLFADRGWTRGLLGVELRAYVSRVAVIGGVPKVSAIFAEAEADFIIIPEKVLQRVKLRAMLRLHRRPGWTRRRMQDLAEVIRPGWRFLKGEERWGPLYRRAVAEVTDPHLDDAAVVRLAEGFVCDYIWARRKMAREEFRTVQRMLHQELSEINFQLLHELKQRRGERTFTKARRIERIATAAELAYVTVDARLEPVALGAALEKSRVTLCELVRLLVGESWRWPEVK
jgi:hypothetical protein